MTMIIILLVLVGVVAIFLITTAVIDRKKRKKLQMEKVRRETEAREAIPNINQAISKVITQNNQAIEKFKVSIGSLKMSDINRKSKEALMKIKQSKNFKLLVDSPKIYELFKNNLEGLIKEKSNNWMKRNQAEVEFFTNYKKPQVSRKILRQKQLASAQKLHQTKRFKLLGFFKLKRKDNHESPK